MDRMIFLEAANQLLFNGRLSSSQRRGMVVKLNAFEAHGITDHRWQAYMLATSYHETGRAMVPVEERGKGRGRPYGEKRKHDGTAYRRPNRLYYGRGDVQLTWYENYERMGRLLGIPLLERPELMLDAEVSARVLIEGMTRGRSGRGDFTGRSLEEYFNDREEDPVNARRVVNGRDRAEEVARYYRKFAGAIRMAVLSVALVMMGCRSARPLSGSSSARVDSLSVVSVVDSLHVQERGAASLVLNAERSLLEQGRFLGEVHSRSVRYDTSLPVDSLTGRPPIAGEVVTRARGRHDRQVADDRQLMQQGSSSREGVARQHGSLSHAVDYAIQHDVEASEGAVAGRGVGWGFLVGLSVGIALASTTKSSAVNVL